MSLERAFSCFRLCLSVTPSDNTRPPLPLPKVGSHLLENDEKIQTTNPKKKYYTRVIIVVYYEFSTAIRISTHVLSYV